jgi:hypothetical protein
LQTFDTAVQAIRWGPLIYHQALPTHPTVHAVEKGSLYKRCLTNIEKNYKKELEQNCQASTSELKRSAHQAEPT